MGRTLIALTLLAFAMVIDGCASVQTVASAPITEGVSTVYAAPYAVVSAAAVESIEGLHLVVEGVDETPRRLQIRFSKPVSALSWGEVGVVNVVRADDAHTRVFVNTEKRDQMQMTGTSEWQFARHIFASISGSLQRAHP